MPQVSPNRGQTILLAAGVFILWGALQDNHFHLFHGRAWHSGWNDMSTSEREELRNEIRNARDEWRQGRQEAHDEIRGEFRSDRDGIVIFSRGQRDEFRNSLHEQRDRLREQRERIRAQRERIREQLREQIRNHKDWDDDWD